MTVNESHTARVTRLLAGIGRKMNVPVPSFEGEGKGSLPFAYSYWTHKIYVEQKRAKPLTDEELSLILAHEVGHSLRRKQILFGVFGVVTTWVSTMAVFLIVPTWVAIALFCACMAQMRYYESVQLLKEEFIADEFGVKFASEKSSYKQLLLKISQERRGGPSPGMLKRLSRLN